MDMLQIGRRSADVRLTQDEVSLLRSSLNEVVNGIDVGEFEVRLGYSEKEAVALMETLESLLERIRSAPR